MLCLLIGCMLFSFSPRLNGQGTNIHNWCWWTIFLLPAWISKRFYLQKENYHQLWYLTKTIPVGLCCRDRKSDTRLSIWNYATTLKPTISWYWISTVSLSKDKNEICLPLVMSEPIFFLFLFFSIFVVSKLWQFFPLFWGFFLKFTQEKRISAFSPKKFLVTHLKFAPKINH